MTDHVEYPTHTQISERAHKPEEIDQLYIDTLRTLFEQGLAAISGDASTAKMYHDQPEIVAEMIGDVETTAKQSIGQLRKLADIVLKAKQGEKIKTTTIKASFRDLEGRERPEIEVIVLDDDTPSAFIVLEHKLLSLFPQSFLLNPGF